MIFHKVDNMPNFDRQVNTELCHKVNNSPNLTLSLTVIPTCHISHILLADHNLTNNKPQSNVDNFQESRDANHRKSKFAIKGNVARGKRPQQIRTREEIKAKNVTGKKSNRSGCCWCHRWWRTEEKWTVEEEEEKLRSGDDDGL